MTAKGYLQQLKAMDIRIDQRQKQVDELRALAFGCGSRKDGERVQTSRSPDALEKNIVKYVDIERECDKAIDEYIDFKNVIIGEIQALEDWRYVQLLYKRYVEYKGFGKIAREMEYSYDSIVHMHGTALKAFEEKYSLTLSMYVPQ